MAAFTCWPGTTAAAGLESLKGGHVLRQLCQASLGSQMAAVAQPHPSAGGWGFPAAVRQSSPRAQESCQPLQPLQQVSAEGLNMEPDVRQDWLCPVGRSALRGELHPCYPLCFCLWLYRCHGWRKKIVVPNPVQKVSFGFFKFFPPY